MSPKLLTVKDLATLFQRDEDTIRAWIKEGVFPHAFKVKEGWYVPSSDIKKMMQKKSGESDPTKIKQTGSGRQPARFVTGWK